MEFTAFAASLSGRKTQAPLYLFFGEETLLLRRAVELLRAASPALTENSLRFSSSEITWPALLSELCTPPFLGGKKLVVLTDESNWIQHEAGNLKAYAASPSSSAVLAVLFPGARAPLSIESKNFVSVSCMPLKPAEAERWVTLELDRRKKKIDRDALTLLLTRTGTELTRIDSALDTLSLYAASRPRITRADVDQIVCDDSTEDAFELALAAARKDLPKTLRLLHRFLDAGESAQALLGRIAWQYRRMADAKLLLESGVRRSEVPGRVQINFYADRFLSLVDAHTRTELLRKHQALLDTDLALKSSGRGTENALLDLLASQLALDIRGTGRDDRSRVPTPVR